jgi:uncharacterized protein (TIGR00255 family)
MTGFGSGAAPLDHALIRVEIRALNHRHQDVRLRLSGELAESSFFLEDLARRILGRGRFDIHAALDGGVAVHAEFDLERLKTLYVALRDLGESIDPNSRISLSTLAVLPGMVTQKTRTKAELEPALELAFRSAVQDLDLMRKREGAFLQNELGRLLDEVAVKLKALEARSESRAARYRERMVGRIRQLLEASGARVESDRLEHEIAILVEKSDITEELARLQSHSAQLRTWLLSAEPQGKKLDFLLQEVGREINTIGAKSHDEELTMFVVELKSDLEKLREQVQNIE